MNVVIVTGRYKTKLQVWTEYVKNRGEHDFEDVLFLILQ